MGHDILAKHPDTGDMIAYNRRSALNPLNQVIYLALGVMDEAYAGASGSGIELDIDLDRLGRARQILEIKKFDDMDRDPNFADVVVEAIVELGITIERGDGGVDVSMEKQFLDKCIEFLKTSKCTHVIVSFC
jgi:hypothetical protein